MWKSYIWWQEVGSGSNCIISETSDLKWRVESLWTIGVSDLTGQKTGSSLAHLFSGIINGKRMNVNYKIVPAKSTVKIEVSKSLSLPINYTKRYIFL